MPPPGTVAFAEDEPGAGFTIHDGIYVKLLTRDRGELIAAAEALAPIP